MSNPEPAPKNWEPTYADYLYLAFTNASAFSPTDVMPFRSWSKVLMLVQAMISLMLALLVVAWAVGALRSRALARRVRTANASGP